MKEEWFATWFDTPYYHILYKNRNEEEARTFIANLVDHLSLPAKSKILDLACGKGRHSKTLFDLGYTVHGVDLSSNSIEQAKSYSDNGPTFEVHDMRQSIPNKTFDAVFNLFTSFGYFDDVSDNARVIQAVNNMLESGGLLVIDFMNAQRVIDQLVASEEKVVDGIEFSIERRYDGSHIFKNISFEAEGTNHQYTERVQALKLQDFQKLLGDGGFEILRTFGDFALRTFDENNSDRLIIIAKKK